MANQQTLAILDFEAIGVTKDEALILTKKLSSELVKNNQFIVLERGKIDTILKEQGFQQTGCITSECAVEVGQILGVSKMASGSIGKLGDIYYVEVKLIDVATSKILKNVDRTVAGKLSGVLLTGIPEIAAELSGKESSDLQSNPVLRYGNKPQLQRNYPQVKRRHEVAVEIQTFNSNNYIYINGKKMDNDEYECFLQVGDYIITEQDEHSSEVYNSDTIRITEDSYEDIEVELGGNRRQLRVGLSLAMVTPGLGRSSLPEDNNVNPIFAPGFHIGFIESGVKYQGLSFNFNTLGPITNDSLGKINIADSSRSFEDKSRSSYFGGFYTLLWEFVKIKSIRMGAGFSAGARVLESEWTETYKESYSSSYYQTSYMADYFTYTRVEFGGPNIRMTFGKNKIFAQLSLLVSFGYFDYEVETFEWDDSNDEWDHDYYSSYDYLYSETSVSPEIDFMLYYQF